MLLSSLDVLFHLVTLADIFLESILDTISYPAVPVIMDSKQRSALKMRKSDHHEKWNGADIEMFYLLQGKRLPNKPRKLNRGWQI